jgi:hypothetical protein
MRLVYYYAALSEVVRAVRAARSTRRSEQPELPATYSYTVPYYTILIPLQIYLYVVISPHPPTHPLYQYPHV